jgi:hypothetical protein
MRSLYYLLVGMLFCPFESGEIASTATAFALTAAGPRCTTRLRQSRVDPCSDDERLNQIPRRSVVKKGMKRLAFALLIDMSLSQPAHAAILGGKERRQLDFCLVNLLRVTYWAESTIQDLKSTDDEERRKKVYLEARLGAKALVTGRLGGGATNRVYQLSTLQFRGCLEDIGYYGKSRQVSDLCQDLLEATAALVEFDGLETTTEPSPRASLTLSMYNPKKATYVERLLSERVIPLSKKLFNSFDPVIRQRCETYVTSTYANEVPTTNKEAQIVADNNIAKQ